jgi:hypothetical protein
MVVPNVNYLFIPLLLLFLFFTGYHLIRGNSYNLVITFIKYNLLLLIVALLVLLGIILSTKIIFFAVKELLYSFVIIFFAISFFQFINTRESYIKLSNIFSNQLLISSIWVSILGIIKYILQLNGIDLPFSLSSDQVGTSLNKDYNFYVLLSLLGIVSLVFNISKFRKVTFYLLISILFINIIFSGSRRGIFFLGIIFVLLFLFGTNLKFEIKKVLLRSAILLTLFVLFLLSLNRYRHLNSIEQKNQSVDLLETSNAQNTITRIIYRYSTLYNREKSVYGFYLDLWARDPTKDNSDIKKYFSTRDGDNLIYNGNFKFGLKFWYPIAGKVQHEIVETPYGKGVRVTRLDADNAGWPLQYIGRNIIFYAGHNYTISFKFKIVKGEEIPFKIGFKTDDPILGSGKASNLFPVIFNLENGWKQGECSHTFWKSQTNIPLFMNSQYNNTVVEFADIKLQDNNSNDSLILFKDQISSDNEKIQFYLRRYDSVYFSKKRYSKKENLFYNGNFEIGTRYWLPAASATEHSIIETTYGKGIKVVRKDGDESYWSLKYDGRPIIYHAGHTYKLSFLLKVLKGTGIPFNVGWWANDGNNGFSSAWRPLNLKTLQDGWTEVICYNKFENTQYDLPTFLNSMKNNSEIEIANVRLVDIDSKDSEPRYVDELKADDVKMQDKISKGPVATNLQPGFYRSRTDRWKYSIELFMSNTLKQKIFGGGFDYLELFGKKFMEGKYDYPHNPFLDAFLYSGIIGGLIYIWYIIMVIYYYFKYYMKHQFFFYCFLIAFIFTFVSGATQFSVPVFSILCIIPFLNKYIIENEMQGE